MLALDEEERTWIRALRSVKMYRILFCLAISDFLMTFIANTCWVFSSRTRYTFPNTPLPITHSIS